MVGLHEKKGFLNTGWYQGVVENLIYVKLGPRLFHWRRWGDKED